MSLEIVFEVNGGGSPFSKLPYAHGFFNSWLKHFLLMKKWNADSPCAPAYIFPLRVQRKPYTNERAKHAIYQDW